MNDEKQPLIPHNDPDRATPSNRYVRACVCAFAFVFCTPQCHCATVCVFARVCKTVKYGVTVLICVSMRTSCRTLLIDNPPVLRNVCH